MVKFLKTVTALLLLAITQSVAGSDIKHVRYPHTDREGTANSYEINLLKFLLAKSGTEIEAVPIVAGVNQARVIDLLKKGKVLDIYWMGTSKELEQSLQPIRIPLYRGLLGHRIFIIHKDKQAVFDRVNSLQALQKLQGAQGIGWSDTAILEYSGLQQTTTGYENIFRMVAAGRVDYFSRGITEVTPELEAYSAKFPQLQAEEKLVLIYPFAMFFFVSKHNDELADVIKSGFDKAYSDGSFSDFFYNYPAIKRALTKVNLTQRKRLEIPNPMITTETMSLPKALWHGR